MFDSLTWLIPSAWRQPHGQARFAATRQEASQLDRLCHQHARHPLAMNDPTAPIRVPLNWSPTPEPASPAQAKARASR